MKANNNTKNILLIIAGVLIGSMVTFVIIKNSGYSPDTRKITEGTSPGLQPSASRIKNKKILYWKAPMDPSYISEQPGKSPMGMDLIPVYDGEEGTLEPGTVKIDPVTRQNMGVKTEIVKIRTLTKAIRTIGRVDYNEKKVYHVHTKIEGWVEKLYADFTGKKVNKDDILLGIYSPQLVATQEEYLLAKKFSNTLKRDNSATESEFVINLSRRRLEFWDVPEHQIKELDEKGTIIKIIHIHSPSRGIITKKHVQEGMFVKPSMSLYTIADISDVWVYADIFEFEIPWIKVGQKAEMTLNSYPGRIFTGKVSFIYPYVEAKTRTVKVRLVFDNPNWDLKPNMYANITLKPMVSKDAVAVPKEAVLFSGERNIVILDRGGGKFAPKEVTIGVEAGGYYQILEGVKEGDKVVTSSQFLIDSESKLKEAISKMLEAKKTEDGGRKTEERQPKANEMDHGAMKQKETGNRSMSYKEMEHDSKSNKKMDHSKMKMDHSNM